MAASPRAQRLFFLALIGLAGLILFTRPDLVGRLYEPAESIDPCRSPLAWQIRHVDPRFGFSRAQLEAAIGEAASVWESASGRQLFRHDTAGAMAIDLVYDERQQASERRRERDASLAEMETEVESLQALLERAEAQAEAARSRYEADPSPTTARAYERAVDRFNGVVTQYNQAVGRFNRALEAAQAEGAPEVTAGDLRTRGRTLGGRLVSVDRVLTVAVAGGYDELVTVLAHELGHALGIEHVDAPDALMAEWYRRGDITLPVELTRADREALAQACELNG